jgi:isopenicillin N synthase-like dioxygenase
MTRTTLKLTKIKTTRKATATKKTATAKTATAKRNAAKAAKTAKDLTDIMAAVKGSASRNIVRAVAAEPDQYEVVVVEYADLLADKDLSTEIERAFGYDGVGVLAVRGVPELERRRQELLPLAHRFANLPDSVKAKYERPDAFYNVGWSHGKEILDGAPDYAKGSFYANPLMDEATPDQAKDISSVSKATQLAFFEPNVWVDEIPELETSFKAMGSLIHRVGVTIARQCDRFVERESKRVGTKYEPGTLEKIVSDSRNCKGRLLHYFAQPSVAAKSDKVGDWCGWHNDHGSLTGLAPAMYTSAAGEHDVRPPGVEKAGLYVRTRRGSVLQVKLPPGCLAYQIGETSQIHTGGLLQATPHAVKGTSGASRQTYAQFMQPEIDGLMTVPKGRTVAQAQLPQALATLPPTVRPLSKRWKEGMNFGEFADATFAAYH